MVLNIYGYVTVKFDALLRGAVALGCLYSRNGWIAVPQDISECFVQSFVKYWHFIFEDWNAIKSTHCI